MYCPCRHASVWLSVSDKKHLCALVNAFEILGLSHQIDWTSGTSSAKANGTDLGSTMIGSADGLIVTEFGPGATMWYISPSGRQRYRWKMAVGGTGTRLSHETTRFPSSSLRRGACGGGRGAAGLGIESAGL